MNGKLSRKWARISIVCIGVFLAGGLVTCVAGFPAGLYAGLPFAITSLIVKFVFLRCPGCGRGGAVPQWSEKQKVYHCPHCGAKLEYDD